MPDRVETERAEISEEYEDLSFEEALTELEAVVDRLEGEALPLDEAVALYHRGQVLAAICQKRLDNVELQVEKLSREP